MLISSVIKYIESTYEPSLQESYDNSGLMCGSAEVTCTGILCALDVTENVLLEAIEKGINLIIAHHPVIFKPLKTISPVSYIERIIILAIKNDLTIYALHTNYDNVKKGVNLALAKKIGIDIKSITVLAPFSGKIAKLYTYVPQGFNEKVRSAIFAAGAGEIGAYSECSFETDGIGTFKPMEGSNPFIGKSGGERERVEEIKMEMVFPVWRQAEILRALKESHPYEEVAYEIMITENKHPETGAGMIGQLSEPKDAEDFMQHLRNRLQIPVLRHNKGQNKQIKKVAFCGGAGSFLINHALKQQADAFVTADLKYHDFFEAGQNMLLVDAGHYESEIGAIDQLVNELQNKFTTFAVLKTKEYTNPICYF